MAKRSHSVLKLTTEVDCGLSRLGVSYSKPMLMLGSCFADNIGGRMKDYGFDVVVNPFGTMYNPVSIALGLERIVGGADFCEQDVVPIGAGDGRFCSFSHHTKMARASVAEFLEEANRQLEDVRRRWESTRLLVVTLGTAWCFRHLQTGTTVCNCLKHVPSEFERYRLSVAECTSWVRKIVELADDRDCIFSVSPIRHMADGAHGNALSKSTLLLAVDEAVGMFADRVEYFPAYEIVLDELRDYRFFADDMAHPSVLAQNYVFDRFMDYALPESERGLLEEGRLRVKRGNHIAM